MLLFKHGAPSPQTTAAVKGEIFPGQLYRFSITSPSQFLISHSGRRQMHLTDTENLPGIHLSRGGCMQGLFICLLEQFLGARWGVQFYQYCCLTVILSYSSSDIHRMCASLYVPRSLTHTVCRGAPSSGMLRDGRGEMVVVGEERAWQRKTYGERTHSSRIHPLLIHVSCLTEWINGREEGTMA